MQNVGTSPYWGSKWGLERALLIKVVQDQGGVKCLGRHSGVELWMKTGCIDVSVSRASALFVQSISALFGQGQLI